VRVRVDFINSFGPRNFCGNSRGNAALLADSIASHPTKLYFFFGESVVEAASVLVAQACSHSLVTMDSLMRS
jgi:hypothetical protein